MSHKTAADTSTPPSVPDMNRLLEQYGCGPIQFSGNGDALYERHLTVRQCRRSRRRWAPRERYEAVARSVRDVLSQRWLRTDRRTTGRTPSGVYYLSMEFLIGRSLANNVTEPAARSARRGARRREGPRLARPARAGARRRPRQWRAGPPRGLLPRLDGDDAAPGHGLRAALRVRHLQADDPGRLAARAAGQLAAAARSVGGRPAARDGGGQARLLVRGARRHPAAWSPAGRRRLLGIPFDRPVVGYGGKTINTLRLWAAAAPDFFDFQAFSAGEFVSALGRAARGGVPDPRALPGRLDEHGPGAALRAGILPCRLLAGRPRAALPPQQ